MAAIEKITTLQGIAFVGGISFDDLRQSIERASLNIQKSIKDAYNTPAQGLKVLGPESAKELTALPTDQ